jgi:hypothetical protein
VGDIWPYGRPRFITFAQAVARLRYVGFTAAQADVGAAIGTAESSRDLSVINDTPSTGDYSVGVWQINYYGSLYAERVREFGTPQYMVTKGLNAQAYACRRVFLQQGWSAWSTYNDGAYRKYLQGGGGGSAPPPGGGKPPGHGILPPTEDYSGTIRSATVHVHALGDSFQAGALALSRLGR